MPPNLVWETIESNEVTPIRGDGIDIEEYSDKYEDDSDDNTVDWGDLTNEDCDDESDCKPSLKDGSLRLTGGRDETEVKITFKRFSSCRV